VAQGADVEVLHGFIECVLHRLCVFTLIECLCNDPFCLCLGNFPRLGKTDRSTSPLTSTFFADQRETEFFLVRTIREMGSDDMLHRTALLALFFLMFLYISVLGRRNLLLDYVFLMAKGKNT
jgi:hypothetical protein